MGNASGGVASGRLLPLYSPATGPGSSQRKHCPSSAPWHFFLSPRVEGMSRRRRQRLLVCPLLVILPADATGFVTSAIWNFIVPVSPPSVLEGHDDRRPTLMSVSLVALPDCGRICAPSPASGVGGARGAECSTCWALRREGEQHAHLNLHRLPWRYLAW